MTDCHPRSDLSLGREDFVLFRVAMTLDHVKFVLVTMLVAVRACRPDLAVRTLFCLG